MYLRVLRRRLLAMAVLAFSALAAAPLPAQVAPPPLKVAPLEILTHHGVLHFRVEIADTEDSREYGLMNRKSLPGDRGMLFDFKVPQPVSFWMKNTFIPLDMIFIAPDGKIISIAHEARPFDETPIGSQGVILGVLEIRGGRAAELGIEPGDRVREKIFSR